MKKIYNLLFLSFLFIILLGNINVNASTVENETSRLNEILDSKERIMKYDAITGETTEVDIEELQEVVKEKYGLKDSKEAMLNTIFSNKSKIMYTPNALMSTNGPLTRYINTTGTIQRAVCKVKSDQGNASACLVGNNVALTAAHVIWNENTKDKHTNLKFYPGYSNGSYTGSCGWSSVYYADNWMNSTRK